jgi:hypothetical protein
LTLEIALSALLLVLIIVKHHHQPLSRRYRAADGLINTARLIKFPYLGPQAFAQNLSLKMPRALDLSSLINSTTYPSVPSIDELEALRNSIKERRASAGARVAQLDPATAESIKNARKEKKRKEKEQETAWLEHVEREAQAGRSKDKGRDKDEGDTVKVKRERSGMSNSSEEWESVVHIASCGIAKLASRGVAVS